MLNKARSKLSKHPQERLTFLEPTETGKISLKGDHRPDVITAIQAHHYMPKEDRFEATKICYELLKANGVYITFENVRPSTEDSVRIGMDYWKNFQLSRGRDAEIVERHLKRFDVEYFPN